MIKKEERDECNDFIIAYLTTLRGKFVDDMVYSGKFVRSEINGMIIRMK